MQTAAAIAAVAANKRGGLRGLLFFLNGVRSGRLQLLFRIVICIGIRLLLSVILGLRQGRALSAFCAVLFIVCTGIALIALAGSDFRQVGELFIDIRPAENKLPVVVDAALND